MAETLSSNVVNYLVWRYLQEAGFGNAALQLSRCWIRDPETLPFSGNVAPHTLIRILQDGMSWDKMHAEVTNALPKYSFGADHGRPYSVRNRLLTLDEGIPAHELAAAAANGAPPDPPAKKGVKRKKNKPTNGVEPRPEPEVNGDAMEIEQNGTAHVPESVRAGSEAAISEADSPSVGEIPMSTLTIGQDAEIQTEVIEDLAPATAFVGRPSKPDSKVQHTLWGPKEAPLLLSAGNSVLQVHLLEKSSEQDVPTILTQKIEIPESDFEVTAMCWESSGDMAVSIRDDNLEADGDKVTKDRLIKIVGGGSVISVISSQAGLVNTLRWNKDKSLLLSLSNDGETGSINIWKDSDDNIPSWSESIEAAILDAVWITDSSFIVCGEKVFKIFEVNESSLTIQRTLDTQIGWEEIRHDPSSGIVAVLGLQDTTYYLGILHPNDSLNLQTHVHPDIPTDLAFRIRASSETLTNGSSVPACILATSSMVGGVRIWDANEPFKCIKKLFTTDNTQASKLAFSPDGSLLAAAGPDAVTVWDVERREVPIASWRAKDVSVEKWNPAMDGEFNLGWDSDGSKLSIALGDQIAVIPVPR